MCIILAAGLDHFFMYENMIFSILFSVLTWLIEMCILLILLWYIKYMTYLIDAVIIYRFFFIPKRNRIVINTIFHYREILFSIVVMIIANVTLLMWMKEDCPISSHNFTDLGNFPQIRFCLFHFKSGFSFIFDSSLTFGEWSYGIWIAVWCNSGLDEI